jgi:hypothetical protein
MKKIYYICFTIIICIGLTTICKTEKTKKTKKDKINKKKIQKTTKKKQLKKKLSKGNSSITPTSQLNTLPPIESPKPDKKKEDHIPTKKTNTIQNEPIKKNEQKSLLLPISKIQTTKSNIPAKKENTKNKTNTNKPELLDIKTINTSQTEKKRNKEDLIIQEQEQEQSNVIITEKTNTIATKEDTKNKIAPNKGELTEAQKTHNSNRSQTIKEINKEDLHIQEKKQKEKEIEAQISAIREEIAKSGKNRIENNINSIETNSPKSFISENLLIPQKNNERLFSTKTNNKEINELKHNDENDTITHFKTFDEIKNHLKNIIENIYSPIDQKHYNFFTEKDVPESALQNGHKGGFTMWLLLLKNTVITKLNMEINQANENSIYKKKLESIQHYIIQYESTNRRNKEDPFGLKEDAKKEIYKIIENISMNQTDPQNIFKENSYKAIDREQ